MKKLLIISYNFPPYWSTGTVRVAKLAKYLPREGWEPVVLTCGRQYFGPGLSTAMDDYKDLVIYRTPFNILEYGERCKQTIRAWITKRRKTNLPSSQKATNLSLDSIPKWKAIYTISPFAKLIRWICPIETFLLWMPLSLLYGASILLTSKDITLIFATGAPYTQMMTGAILKWLFPRCRLVIDFRDAWLEDDNRYYPTRLHRWFEYRMERFVIESANRVTLVSDEVLPLFVRKYGHPERFAHIPNGFDPDDYLDIPLGSASKGHFTLNHFGGIGSGRNISGFLRALKLLSDGGKISSDSFQAHFYGGLNRFFHHEIDSLCLRNLVQVHERIPYLQGIRKMAETSVLLLVVDKDPSTSFYPTKFFEYLNTRRPILLVGPERGAGKFIVRERIGQCVSEDDVSALTDAIWNLYQRNKDGGLPAHHVDISRFSRRHIAKEMANLFDSL